nr:general odorant-binding protein 56a-like [Drosophila bipectinata]
MRTLTVSFLCLCLAGLASSYPNEYSGAQKECAAKGGLKPKCFMHCVFEKLGVTRNGKLVTSGYTNLVKDLSARDQKIIKDIETKCMNISDDNKCEMAFKLSQCLKS